MTTLSNKTPDNSVKWCRLILLIAFSTTELLMGAFTVHLTFINGCIGPLECLSGVLVIFAATLLLIEWHRWTKRYYPKKKYVKEYLSMKGITTTFDNSTNTLTISGEGDLSWRDIASYSGDTEHVVIEGDDIMSTNMSNMFAMFNDLISIVGHIDTSECEDFSYCYADCYKLVEPIADLDTSNGTEFDFFHSDNMELSSVEFNSTAKGQKFSNMFNGCEMLTNIDGVTIPSHIDIDTISDMEDVRELLRELVV